MDIKVNSANAFTGKLTANINLKNPDRAKRLKNIITEYSRITQDKPYKNLQVNQVYNKEDDIMLLYFRGKDTYITNTLMDDFMRKMSDSQIAKQFSKIADYLQLKHRKNAIFSKYAIKLVDLEKLMEINASKAKTLSEHGKEKFAKQFAKIAELNKQRAESIKLERDKILNDIDAKMRETANGDKEILDDILLS